jgi:hypothetical protein
VAVAGVDPAVEASRILRVLYAVRRTPLRACPEREKRPNGEVAERLKAAVC